MTSPLVAFSLAQEGTLAYQSVTGITGMAVTAALIGCLVARVVVSALSSGRPHRVMKAVDLALVPLIVAFIAVVLIRFDRLSA